MFVVGMDAIRLPRIVPEHDIGLVRRITRHTAAARGQVVVELAVDVPQEHDVGRAEHRRRVPLLLLARRDERGEVGVAVPGPLGPVGADTHRHVRCRRPPTSRGWRRSRTRCRRRARRSPGPAAEPGGRPGRSWCGCGCRRMFGRGERGEGVEVGRHIDVEAELGVVHDAHGERRGAGPPRRGGVPSRGRTRT